MRIGNGYDLHTLAADNSLVLGGIEIPSAKGTIAHSDGDVILHAIIDAWLGALALGDIGNWFPDNDEEFRGIDSKILLKRVLVASKSKSWRLVNLDVTVIAEAPKLSPYIKQMRQSIADLFSADIENVSVKAKTNEKQDAIGKQQAIAAWCTMLLEKK